MVGYVFITNDGATSYYRNIEADNKGRWHQAQTSTRSWTQALAEVIWPAASITSAPNGSDDNGNQGISIQPSWLQSTIQVSNRRISRRGRRRKKIAAAASDLGDSNVTTVDSTLAKELGLCALDSWNMNTWHSGMPTIAESSADVALLQETRVDEAEACLRAEEAARVKGWSAKINKAVTTQEGGSSAGVGIMTERHIGMKSSVNETIKKVHRSRISCAWTGTGRRGGFYAISAYLWTSEGLSSRIKELLEEITRVTKLLKGPWTM